MLTTAAGVDEEHGYAMGDRVLADPSQSAIVRKSQEGADPTGALDPPPIMRTLGVSPIDSSG
jgi:hypothetical protein